MNSSASFWKHDRYEVFLSVCRLILAEAFRDLQLEPSEVTWRSAPNALLQASFTGEKTVYLMMTEALCHDCAYCHGHLTVHTCLSHFQMPSVLFSNTINLEAETSHRTAVFTTECASAIFGTVVENDSLISFPAFIIILDIKTPTNISTSSKVDAEFMGEKKGDFGFISILQTEYSIYCIFLLVSESQFLFMVV